MDIDNLTEEDVQKMTELAMDSFGDIIDWRDTAVEKFRDIEMSPPANGREFYEFAQAMIQDFKDMGKLATYIFVTLLLTRYHYTGQQKFKEAALNLIPKKKIEEIFDDKPTLYLVGEEDGST